MLETLVSLWVSSTFFLLTCLGVPPYRKSSRQGFSGSRPTRLSIQTPSSERHQAIEFLFRRKRGEEINTLDVTHFFGYVKLPLMGSKMKWTLNQETGLQV